jgi:hypothetical protein
MRESGAFEKTVCEGGQSAGAEGERQTLQVHALLQFIHGTEEPDKSEQRR